MNMHLGNFQFIHAVNLIAGGWTSMQVVVFPFWILFPTLIPPLLWLRRVLHWTEHPPLNIEELRAVRCNERTNLALLNTLGVRPGVPAHRLAVA